MGKMLMFLYLVFLIVMFGEAIVEPQSPLFWVASSDVTYNYIRLATMGALAILLFTRPPRRIWVRRLTGSIAAVTVVWALQQTYLYHMLPFRYTFYCRRIDSHYSDDIRGQNC